VAQQACAKLRHHRQHVARNAFIMNAFSVVKEAQLKQLFAAAFAALLN
jgi:hypothetical protein